MLLSSKLFVRNLSGVHAYLRPNHPAICPVNPGSSFQVRHYARPRSSAAAAAAAAASASSQLALPSESTETTHTKPQEIYTPPPPPKPAPYTPSYSNSNLNSSSSSQSSSQPTTIPIAPREYIHVYDSSTNITRVESGPKNFVRKENERVVAGPLKMITILPGYYVKIENPVKIENGKPVFDEFGQAEIKEGSIDYRFQQKPFPLYPGEVYIEMKPMKVVDSNTALKLQVSQAYESDDEKGGKVMRNVGQEWLFKGPGVYVPRPEEEIVQIIAPSIIKPHQALRLRAKKILYNDAGEIIHYPGEEWLHRKAGAYLPHVDEEVVEIREAMYIPDNKAVHFRAKSAFTDVYGAKHQVGDEYLVTSKMASNHIQEVHEEIVGTTPLTILHPNQYVIITNPVDPKTGKNQLGKRKQVIGEDSFFVQPGETCSKVEKAISVKESEALHLKAKEDFDDCGEKRITGQEWLVYGPKEYIPPLQVEVLDTRKKILQGENGGTYVVDTTTGNVRVATGSFFLQVNEKLYEKEWDPLFVSAVESQLKNDKGWEPSYAKAVESQLKPKSEGGVDRSIQIAIMLNHGEAVQIYDTQTAAFRTVVGPDAARLGPYEDFVVKEEGKKDAQVMRSLGPQRLQSSVTVETVDHTPLTVEYAVTWSFPVNKASSQEDLSKIFKVGDLKEHIDSIVGAHARSTVSTVTFPQFNANWSTIVNDALLGKDKEYKDPATLLTLTNMDVLAVRPLDPKTKTLLDHNVQKTVVLTTDAALKAAQYAADLATEQSKLKTQAAIEHQTVTNDINQEKERSLYWELKAKNAAYEREVTMATAQVQAAAKIYEAREVALADADKFAKMVNALGKDTLKSIAQASASNDMVKGLGLKGFLLTDGKTPINLIDTAQRMFSDMAETAKVKPSITEIVEVDEKSAN